MAFQVLKEGFDMYLESLRAEAEAALKMYGGYTDNALTSMVLMDSFIRVLNRVYTTGAGTCALTIMSPDLIFEFLFVSLSPIRRFQALMNTNDALGVIGVISDVGTAILPISAIFSLHLPMHKKVGVAAIFGIGMM